MFAIDTTDGLQLLQYSEHMDLEYCNGIRMSGDPEGEEYLAERRNLTDSIPDKHLIAMRHEDGNHRPSNITYMYGAEWTIYRGQTFTFNLQLRWQI